MSDFEKELAEVLNRHNKEGDSNTPDFILARFLLGCLHAFNDASNNRERWYSYALRPAGRSGPVVLCDSGKTEE